MPYPAPISDALILEDGGSAITADRVGRFEGATRVFDTGSGAPPWHGALVYDVSAITSGGGRVYSVYIELSNASDFSSGVVERNAFSIAAAGQGLVWISNNVLGTYYRYVRVRFDVEGPTPSITLECWLANRDDFDTYSTAQLTGLLGAAAALFNDASETYRNWSAGVIDGGPNGDGEYPLYNAAGEVFLVPCPAKIAATAGMSYGSFMALTAHIAAIPADTAGPDVMIGLSGALKRGKLFLFAARRTQDLEPIATLISDELIPSYNASTGQERKIAVGELMRQTMGMLNPLQYGVKNDCITTRKGFSMEAGDNIVECTEPLFLASDVGKHIQIGGVLSGGAAGKGTIIAYLNTTHVRVSFTAGVTTSGQDGNFGTLNTAAMQNALNACFNPRGVYNYGAILMLPQGGVLTGALYYHPRTGIVGHGSKQSSLVRYNDSFDTTSFPRYDGDTNSYPITQYQDGSYYIPVYPNAYVGPHYAGSYVPEIAPTLCNRIGVDKDGVEWPFSDSGAGPSKRGYKVDSDFNVFNDFAMEGARYCSSRLMPGLEFRGGLFDDGVNPYHQYDPYLRMRDLNIYLHGHVPLATFGQCSGILTGIDSEDNNLCGYWHRAFDCNISNCYFMGNAGPGIVAGGTNTNWTTMKVSFNGSPDTGWFWGSSWTSIANMYIDGIGHNWNNARFQESWGPNVHVNGRGNDFTGCHFDDTGCVVPKHKTIGMSEEDAEAYLAANMNWITPAIHVGPNGDDLRLNDVGMGGLVHVGQNYASHAIFWGAESGDMGENTSGRMFTKSVSSWFNSGNPAITGDFTPNEWGASGGTPPAGTNLTLNGVDITTL